ncbi:MAG: acyl-CoA dehydrogenase family protein [Planctomycetaceae bacterium]
MSDLFAASSFQSLLRELRREPFPDEVEAWPAERFAAMAQADVMKWNLPAEWGGIGLIDAEMLEGLRLLSSACLVTTFILTQRNAACQRIVTSSNDAAKHRYLPDLCAGKTFATVGISHLTTSRQHVKTPPVQVTPVDSGFVLNGIVPWATSATRAQMLVTGGQLTDGRQILAAIPVDRAGVEVQPPVRLMALNASQTGAVLLNDVRISQDEVLHGPVTGVMKQGAGGGAGSLGTSALAIGAACGTLRQLAEESVRRPDLTEFVDPLQDECDHLTADLQLAATGQHPDGEAAAESLRRQANSLALRSAQSWLAATKGAGYVAGHPAEQAVRESMFFLVWSCPQPVLTANLRELACASAGH